jgi:hypothetical protein
MLALRGVLIMEMTFGKHIGKSIFSLPDSYLRWLATSGSDPYIAEFAANVLRRWGRPKASEHITFADEESVCGEPCVYIASPFSLADLVKDFPGRAWDTYRKQWYIPPSNVDECKLIIEAYDNPKAPAAAQQTLF